MALLGDFPERLQAGSRLTARVAGGDRELTVAGTRRHGTHVLVRFEGVESVEQARALSGGDLYADRRLLTLPSPDFIFDDEIQKFRCVSTSGESLGRAVAFERFGQNCCLRIERDGKAFLVPYAHPIVVEVSRDRFVIVLDPPDGLFEL